MNDLELLRQYEPIARFTEGELFFPMAVDEYVKSSSLWVSDPNGQESLVASEGELDLQNLASYDSGARGHIVHLRFIAEPLAGIRYPGLAGSQEGKIQRFRANGTRPIDLAPRGFIL